jgi:rare lipoprotein A
VDQTRALIGVLLAAAMPGCTMIGSAELAEATRAPGPSGSASPGWAVSEAPAVGGNMAEYRIDGRTYRVLDSSYGYDERGLASWYGSEFQGRPTSSGEAFDKDRLTAAHRSLPLPSWVRVTNLANGRSVVLRVNDRGPFADPDRRIIDVSYAAALELGMVQAGTASVRVQAVEPWQYRTPRGGSVIDAGSRGRGG